MEVSDFEGKHKARSEEELDAILLRRRSIDGVQVNSFWMGQDEQEFPLFSLLVRDELACVWFTPEENHPGFIANGTAQALDPYGTTMFRLNLQVETIPNDQSSASPRVVKPHASFSGPMRCRVVSAGLSCDHRDR